MNDGNSKPAGAANWLPWLVVCSVGLTALALVAAHAPERIRLLVLLSVAFGGIAGWGMALHAGQLGLSANRISLSAVMVLVAGALAGQTLEAWRVSVQRRKADFIQKTQASPMLHAPMEKLLNEEMAGEWLFETYLQNRLSGLKTLLHHEGDWPGLVVVAFWMFEVLAGAASAAWVFRRTLSAQVPA